MVLNLGASFNLIAMKKFKLLVTAAFLFISVAAFSQKDWSKANIADDYKMNVSKLSGGVAKSLKAVPTFVCDYKVLQRIEQHGANSKGGGPSVFSGASFQGVEQAAYQKMIDDLHASLLKQLEAAGLTMADGNAIVNGEFAVSQNDGKNDFAGVHDGSIKEEKVDMTKDRQAIFRPAAPLYFTDRQIPGTYYMKLAKKENVNLMYVSYWITFAGFEADRGYNSKSLTTSPYLTVTPIVTLITPKGLWSSVTLNKGPIAGNDGWSSGVEEVKSRDGSFWGLSSSADYVVVAKQDEYIKEVSGIVGAFQKAMTEAVKAELE